MSVQEPVFNQTSAPIYTGKLYLDTMTEEDLWHCGSLLKKPYPVQGIISFVGRGSAVGNFARTLRVATS